MPWSFRMLGALPVLFFAAYALSAFRQGRLADSLWMCHFANLILAWGIFSHSPAIVGLAVSWLVIGVPLWAYDKWQTGTIQLESVVTHLGGTAIGLYALSRLRMGNISWLYGVLLFLAVQQLCRWLAPAELNVNLAHRVYDGWTGVFSGYAIYWLVTTLAAALGLWGVGRMLVFLFPPLREL